MAEETFGSIRTVRQPASLAHVSFLADAVWASCAGCICDDVLSSRLFWHLPPTSIYLCVFMPHGNVGTAAPVAELHCAFHMTQLAIARRFVFA